MRWPHIPSGAVYAVAGALLAGLVLSECHRPAPPPPLIQVDTADASAWRTRAAELERQMADTVGALAQLRARLEGQETREPARVTVYDTVVDLRTDTVTLALAVDGRGRLTQTLALPTDSAGHRPADTSPILVADCDEGYRVEGTHVRCDPARLGHLTAFLGAGLASSAAWGSGVPPPLAAHAAVGLSWSPSYRSTWSVELRADATGRAVLAVRRGLRLW